MSNNKRFTAILQQTAPLAEPSAFTCRAMLNAIMPEATAAGRVSYNAACQAVESLSSGELKRRRNSNAVLSLGMMAATLALLLMPGLIQPITAGDGAPRVVVSPTSPVVGLFTIVDPDTPLAAAPGQGVAPLEIAELTVVSDVNAPIPTMESYTVESGFVYIRFASSAAVDWPAFYAQDQNGQAVTPLEIIPEQGMVVFTLPEGNLDIFISTVEGACGQCTLYLE